MSIRCLVMPEFALRLEGIYVNYPISLTEALSQQYSFVGSCSSQGPGWGLYLPKGYTLL
jgi:hypothetical protein